MSSKSKNEVSYDEWSASYDTGLNSTVATDDVCFPPLWKHVRDMKVLEIGCGTGRHTERVVNQDNNVVGIDLSGGMLDVARKRLRDRAVTLIHGDFLEMDLRELSDSEPFDVAISALVLEHISDPRAVFERVGSLLKSGGSFFISEIYPARAATGRLAHFERQPGEEVWLDSFAHSTEAMAEAARAAGFEIVQTMDGLGPAELQSLNPKWVKYVGFPMTKMFEFRWSRGGR